MTAHVCYRTVIISACMLIASSLFCSNASAQIPKVFGELLPKAKTENRDPTQAQGELKELLSQSEVNQNQPATPTMPSIQLRGKVIGAKKSMAILSIGENQWLTVQANQSYILPDYGVMELRVIAITADKIEVEFLPQGRRLVLP